MSRFVRWVASPVGEMECNAEAARKYLHLLRFFDLLWLTGLVIMSLLDSVVGVLSCLLLAQFSQFLKTDLLDYLIKNIETCVKDLAE